MQVAKEREKAEKSTKAQSYAQSLEDSPEQTQDT